MTLVIYNYHIYVRSRACARECASVRVLERMCDKIGKIINTPIVDKLCFNISLFKKRTTLHDFVEWFSLFIETSFCFVLVLFVCVFCWFGVIHFIPISVASLILNYLKPCFAHGLVVCDFIACLPASEVTWDEPQVHRYIVTLSTGSAIFPRCRHDE